MRKFLRFLLCAISILAGLIGLLIALSSSVWGGSACILGAVLLWPSIADRVSEATKSRWLSILSAIALILLVAPIVTTVQVAKNTKSDIDPDVAAKLSMERKAAEEAKNIEKKRKKEEERKRKIEKERIRFCSDTTMAFVMSQGFVKRELKAPSTAEFPYISDKDVSVQKKGECKFLVRGYVDAQNSFGAMLRNRYSIEMEYLPDEEKWMGSNLKM